MSNLRHDRGDGVLRAQIHLNERRDIALGRPPAGIADRLRGQLQACAGRPEIGAGMTQHRAGRQPLIGHAAIPHTQRA